MFISIKWYIDQGGELWMIDLRIWRRGRSRVIELDFFIMPSGWIRMGRWECTLLYFMVKKYIKIQWKVSICILVVGAFDVTLILYLDLGQTTIHKYSINRLKLSISKNSNTNYLNNSNKSIIFWPELLNGQNKSN